MYGSSGQSMRIKAPLSAQIPTTKDQAGMLENSGKMGRSPMSLSQSLVSDPVTIAIYTKENNLLELEGWKKFARLSNRQKKRLHMENQAKL